MQPPILLASSSPYRAALLSKLGIDFMQMSPNVDEASLQDETAINMAQRLSMSKAKAAQLQYPDHIIIASDQVACTQNGSLLTKPHTMNNATKQLQLVSGETVTFYTGLTVLSPISHNSIYSEQSIVDTYIVHFRQLSNIQIEHYIKHEMPLDCAGSFKSEGMGITLFSRLEGDDPNTLIGLPLIQLYQLLLNINIDTLLIQPTLTQKTNTTR